MKTAATLLALGLAAAVSNGCNQKTYLKVDVALDPSVAGVSIAYFDLAVNDGDPLGDHHDAGRHIPDSPVPGGIPFDGGTVTLLIEGVTGSSVNVLVNGLNQDGGALVSGQTTTPVKLVTPVGFGFGTAPSQSITIPLTKHCQFVKSDCDPQAYCAATVTCSAVSEIGFGACIPGAPTIDPPFDTHPCGPRAGLANGGFCEDGGCLYPYCGDGVLDVDAGEQCDNGPANSDDAGNACRTNCLLAHCGDGVVDTGERCDLGSYNGQGVPAPGNPSNKPCNITCNLFGSVTTKAGDGDAGGGTGDGDAFLRNQLGIPRGVTVLGNDLYLIDGLRNAVRQIDLTTFAVHTVAGGSLACNDADGSPPDAGFCTSVSGILAWDGGLLITDDSSLRFLALTPTLDGGILSTLAGALAVDGTTKGINDAGTLQSALYCYPPALTSVGPVVFTDSKATIAGSDVMASDFAQGLVSLVGSLGSGTSMGGMTSLDGLVYFTSPAAQTSGIFAFDPSAPASFFPQTPLVLTPSAASPVLSVPDALCTDGKSIYVGTENGIQQFFPDAGLLALVAGGNSSGQNLDGFGVQASFSSPVGCVFEPDAGALYVIDATAHILRQIQ